MVKPSSIPPFTARNEGFTPVIWFEESTMYASCRYFAGKNFIDIHVNDRRTFESRLVQTLKRECGVLASNVMLHYHKSAVEIIFKDDEEFVMAKLTHNTKN